MRQPARWPGRWRAGPDRGTAGIWPSACWPHLAGWRWLPGSERGHGGVIAAGVQPGRSGQVADGQHQAAQQPGGYDGRLAVAVVRGRRQALTRCSSTAAWVRSARRGCAGPRILPRRGDLGNALIGRSRPYRWHAVAEPVPGAPMAGQAPAGAPSRAAPGHDSCRPRHGVARPRKAVGGRLASRAHGKVSASPVAASRRTPLRAAP